MSDDVEERIERGLILYLREVHNIKAVSAHLGMNEAEIKSWGGCETCGTDTTEVITPLYYRTEGDEWDRTIELDTQYSINLLSTLLPYIDRAN